MLKRALPITMSIGLALASAWTVPAADASPASAKAKRATAFALQAFGYGSRVVGGDTPAGSDRSAFQVISCTNKAGLDKSNGKANVNLGGGLGLADVKTRVWTTDTGGKVSSWARHTIQEVTLVDTPGGSLTLHGVSSVSHTWHDDAGFHASTEADIAKIVLDAADAPPVSIPVPDEGQQIRIPLVGTLRLGAGRTSETGSRAVAQLDAVRLHVNSTDATSYLAHTRTSINDGVTEHLFGGSSYGTKVNLLDQTGTSDQTPFQVMPCQGTGGDIKKTRITHADLNAGMDARNLRVAQQTTSDAAGSTAWEQASVGRVHLGNQLVIREVVGKAQAVKRNGTLTTSTRGTSLSKVYYQGEQVHFPVDRVLRIPGVAKVERRLVEHFPGGVEVTAVRVTLLDGRLAVINLGHAKVRISASGL
jgi:hypothetical protein